MSPTDGSLPLQLDFTTVTFDVPSAGISVPGYIYYVSPTQVNAFVPWELAGQSSAQMKVTTDETFYGNVITIPLQSTAPGLFLYGGNVAIATDQNYNLVTAANPAVPGQAIHPLLQWPGAGNESTGQRIACLIDPAFEHHYNARSNHRRTDGANNLQRSFSGIRRLVPSQPDGSRGTQRGQSGDHDCDRRPDVARANGGLFAANDRSSGEVGQASRPVFPALRRWVAKKKPHRTGPKTSGTNPMRLALGLGWDPASGCLVKIGKTDTPLVSSASKLPDQKRPNNYRYLDPPERSYKS